MSAVTPESSVARVWAMPILVTVVSAIALIVGLLADGLADVVAWLGAGLPIGLTSWHVARAFRRRAQCQS